MGNNELIPYQWPSQLQASNGDDTKVLHLAQTLYSEFAGVKDKKLQHDYMVMGASSAENLYNKKEYRGQDWDTYLFNRFNGINKPQNATRVAMSGEFKKPDEQYAWKKSMQVSYGIVNGLIPNDGTQFYHTDDEISTQKKGKKFDYTKVNQLGKLGDYNRMAYKKTEPEKIQEKLKSLNLYKGEVDGELGPMSQAAIHKFQLSKGLDADGIVGPKTKAALFGK